MPPIDHIPPEVLSIIFLHLLPEVDTWDFEYVPIVLGQVSKLWRTLALALPALWASLNIKCNETLYPPMHIIRTHLLLSAAHPLSIVLDTSDAGDLYTPPNPEFPAVLAALVAARSRWRDVSITLPEATQETIDAITQGDAPLLERFYYGSSSWEASIVPSRALQGRPRLESFTWSCHRAWLRPVLEGETCAQLTTLCLRVSLYVSDCLVLLQLSPRLSTAHFYNINFRGDMTTSHRCIHTGLHKLDAGGTYATMLVDSVTLPALVGLCLEVPSLSYKPQTTLSAFLVRSTPPLRSLSITDLCMSEPELLHTLALAGGLHTLAVRGPENSRVPLTATLIDALHPSHAGAPLCPRLDTLVLDSTLEAPDGVCAAMLRARWEAESHGNGVAKLKAAHITLKGTGHERDRAEMRALKAEGMLVPSCYGGGLTAAFVATFHHA